jgi:diaminopimelate epimerase
VKEIVFHKFHGTGNDFVIIDDRNRSFPVDSTLIRQMCNRHFGVGADGLIIFREKEGVDFEMIYYNSDGNESTMCGNGGRCAVAFADFLSLPGLKKRFSAIDGIHLAEIKKRQARQWQVKLKMSDVHDIKLAQEGYLLDTGSPHLAIFTSDIKLLDVNEKGRRIRYSGRFKKEGINVNFVERLNDELFVRTYERGVESETLSCGTGVTASALAWARKQKLPEGTITVRTRGGCLKVSFFSSETGYEDVWLEGPAAHVFEGILITQYPLA